MNECNTHWVIINSTAGRPSDAWRPCLGLRGRCPAWRPFSESALAQITGLLTRLQSLPEPKLRKCMSLSHEHALIKGQQRVSLGSH